MRARENSAHTVKKEWPTDPFYSLSVRNIRIRKFSATPLTRNGKISILMDPPISQAKTVKSPLAILTKLTMERREIL
jgi:hypothetical protein